MKTTTKQFSGIALIAVMALSHAWYRNDKKKKNLKKASEINTLDDTNIIELKSKRD